jgi:hypothetical protein
MRLRERVEQRDRRGLVGVRRCVAIERCEPAALGVARVLWRSINQGHSRIACRCCNGSRILRKVRNS